MREALSATFSLFFFTWIGIANTAPKGMIPPPSYGAFYLGAAILILCVLYTFAKVKEMPPKEYANSMASTLQGRKRKRTMSRAC